MHHHQQRTCIRLISRNCLNQNIKVFNWCVPNSIVLEFGFLTWWPDKEWQITVYTGCDAAICHHKRGRKKDCHHANIIL